MSELKYSLSEEILEKVKKKLKQEKMTFLELAQKIEFTDSGLRRAFDKNSLSIQTLYSISKILRVDISFFFEDKVIDRFVDEVLKRPENPDLKTFMFGFSRDIAKGMKLEEAVYKNMAPESHKNGLMI